MKEICMLLVAVILWGTAIAPTKWALESIQPFTLLFIRLSLQVEFVCYSHLSNYKNQLYIKSSMERMSLLAFTGVAGYFMFTSYGISLTSGLHVSIIDAVITISYNFFSTLLKEKIRLNYWIGIILGAIGVLLLRFHLKVLIKKCL